jgi:2'-5' RNA ligase
MYYVMLFFPQFSPELSQSIAAIREVHDPTAQLVPPHVTLLFPIGSRFGAERLIDHLDDVTRQSRPFEIHFGSFSKSSDHWLFLELDHGSEQVRSLYRAIYSGSLEEYRNEAFVPHLGLGLFLKPGVLYDWRHPRDADFDQVRYEAALKEAQSIPLSTTNYLVDRLHLWTIPESFGEWTTGQRASIPRDARMVAVREFPLSQA